MIVTQVMKLRPTEAIVGLARRVLMPTDLSTEGLAGVEAWIREQSFFSAKVMDEHFLELAQKAVGQSMNIMTETGDNGLPVDRTSSIPKARVALKDYLDMTGYEAPEGKRGTIEDLESNARLNLIIETNTGFARGKADRVRALEGMDVHPAQELYRMADVEEPRDWPERWAEAGGQFYEGDADYAEGRMIAMVDDPIWEEISAFGYAYPPFDFNSQMGLRPVSRDEALYIGLVQPGDDIPETDSGEVDLDVSDFSDEMMDILKDVLPDGLEISGGKVVES